MYIRTKDGVYEVKVNKYHELVYCKDNQIVLSCDILKQAENLEELCDEFVIEWLPTNHKDIFTIDKYSKEVVKSCIGNSKTKVYGAIWTDKGLIFVAKMSDKGALELI